MKKYKTSLIDEASFFVMKGLRYKVKTTGKITADWYFDDTPQLEKLRTLFYTGTPVVSLHKWLTVRQQLKFETKSQLHSDTPSGKRIPQKYNEHVGKKYFWLDKKTGAIHLYTFESTKKHITRLNSGNFFATKELAQEYKKQIFA